MLYGYIRVSSQQQNLARQRDALLKYGVAARNMFADKESGKNFARHNYRKLIRKIRQGDCIVVTSLDRLGRNYEEIQQQWRIITSEKKVDIIVLDMPLLNTTVAPNSLTGRFIADIVLQILSYVAETERNSIRSRQAEGIIAAKARGVHFGRLPMNIPQGYEMITDRVARKEISITEAAKFLQVSRSWLYKRLHGEIRQ